ncbi:V(D)J recombination-activating protein 1-like [Amphiura filiformis]|uniref:V(D)J recombination-activating protein 1-like n=1 Tax=Amphiura filiformis TaxID=82378 RepID=UPI003B21E264
MAVEERSLLPGCVKFDMDPPVLSSDGTQKEDFEPLDVQSGYPQDPACYPPAVDGRRWPLNKAIAAALHDLDDNIVEGIAKVKCKCVSDAKFKVFIKYGDDGMGDVKIKKGTKVELIDKVLRLSFAIYKITSICSKDGSEHLVFEETAPGSEKCCRPILVARADESSPDVALIIQPIMQEISNIQQSKMHLNERVFSFDMKGTMYDEKRVRTVQGFGGAGSDYLCTLCDATRADAAANPLGSKITRTYDVNKARYTDRKYNPEKMSTNALYKNVLGQTGEPQVNLTPMIDSTHMNINIAGRVLHKIYVQESAGHINQSMPSVAFKAAAKKLDFHLRKRAGLMTPMMADGNYARRLIEPAIVVAVKELVSSEDRKLLLEQLIDNTACYDLFGLPTRHSQSICPLLNSMSRMPGSLLSC